MDVNAQYLRTMDVPLDKILTNLSERGGVEWDLAVEKARCMILADECMKLKDELDAQKAKVDDESV